MAGKIQDRLKLHWELHRWGYFWNTVFAFAIVVSVLAWQTRHVPSGLVPNLPMQVLKDGRIESTSLHRWRAEHPGTPVALHFWADWCPNCRTEQHSVTRLAKDWPVLTVAMQSGTADNVNAVLEKRQLPWETVIDQNGEITRSHGFHAVPAFMVVDSNGIMRASTVGYTTELGMRLRLWWAENF